MGLDMILEKVQETGEQTIMQEAMYWRKAYSIMDWFCTRINKRYYDKESRGIHNCAIYTFSSDELKELIKWCKKFTKNPEKAMDEITPYWYEERWRDYEISQCERTAEELEELVNDTNIDYFAFHGWW